MLPEHIDSSNAGQVREELLRIVNHGAAVLIADLTATVSCDHSGVEAVARAYQRAVASGTELRLVVAAEVVRRMFSMNGLHRLISMYPTLDAALAAGRDASELPVAPGEPVITPAVPRPRATDHRRAGRGNGAPLGASGRPGGTTAPFGTRIFSPKEPVAHA